MLEENKIKLIDAINQESVDTIGAILKSSPELKEIALEKDNKKLIHILAEQGKLDLITKLLDQHILGDNDLKE
jgi:hypothetical protein